MSSMQLKSFSTEITKPNSIIMNLFKFVDQLLVSFSDF